MLNSGCNHRQRYVLAACLDVNSAWLKLFALSKLKKKSLQQKQESFHGAEHASKTVSPGSISCVCLGAPLLPAAPSLPQVPECLLADITSHVGKALGSRRRATHVGKQTEKDTINRRHIQNQCVGPAALVWIV